ncbi:hypothetical protein TNCV_860721 [Trichonephila clavipes]|nr:hypothetical protein TNCV_860721 [Trichonephila clavipes]
MVLNIQEKYRQATLNLRPTEPFEVAREWPIAQRNWLIVDHCKGCFLEDQARRRFVEWAQNEIAGVPDFRKRILFSDEAHFWLNGYVNKQNGRIRSEANPKVYVETP